MPAKRTNLSAKDFRAPLLLVLGELTQYQAGKDIKFEQTYTPLFRRMNIAQPEDYGRTDLNILWVERWTQFAFQQLCTDGLATRVGRGRWTLTPAGVQEALAKAAAAPTLPLVEEKMEDPVVAPVADPVPAPPVNTGISLPVGPQQPADPYHADPYLRGLAAKSTGCMGAFSEQAPTCRDCPLRGGCINAVAAQLSRMAGALHEEDKRKAKTPASGGDPAKPAAPTTPRTKTVVVDPAASDAGAVDDYAWIASAQVNEVNARVKVKCRHCGQYIDQGTAAIWAHLPGATASKGSAMFHKGCFKQVTGRNV